MYIRYKRSIGYNNKKTVCETGENQLKKDKKRKYTLSGNRTRVERMGTAHSTTEPTMLKQTRNFRCEII